MAYTSSGTLFCTRQSEAELVVPAEATPHETKKLSDIDDQEGLRFQLPFIMFYKNNPVMKAQHPALIIKEALAQALVYYYPLAGRLREGPNRKLMVDCAAQGILFIEADAAISLHQLGHAILPPCPYMKDFLAEVPGSDRILGFPLLLVQVTRLTCGGFVFAIRMNHTICDSLGLVQFLNLVAQFARAAPIPISHSPVWQRQLFSARHPPRITCLHHEYQESIDNHCHSEAMDTNQMAHNSFFFGPEEILSIRNRLPLRLRKCSTFEILSACLWKCRTAALELKPNEIVGISPFINARGKQGLEVPDGYYGNAFAFPTALSEAGLLCQRPLAYALELIRKAKAQMSKEYISSVADLMVLKGRPMYRTTGNYLVADTTRVGFQSVDFGWGEAVYGGSAGAIPFVSFYARFRNWKGEDGIVVPILLPRPAMKRFLCELVRITTEEAVDESYDLMALETRSKL